MILRCLEWNPGQMVRKPHEMGSTMKGQFERRDSGLRKGQGVRGITRWGPAGTWILGSRTQEEISAGSTGPGPSLFRVMGTLKINEITGERTQRE